MTRHKFNTQKSIVCYIFVMNNPKENLKKNSTNMAILPKAIYRFNALSIKLSMTFSTEIEQLILTLYEPTKDPELPMQKKNKAEGITLQDYIQYYKTTIFKRVVLA